ncbi:hypothetical protein O9992_01530 [Vibrio lentus]|nr:hypothetical protein [Vibrio lentus]
MQISPSPSRQNSAGKTFDVENFSIYYENFNSTATPEKALPSLI